MWNVLNVDTGELMLEKPVLPATAELITQRLNGFHYYKRVYAAVKVNEDGSVCRYNATTGHDMATYCSRPVYR